MNCEILETLYVRSNGDVPCNDDAGESILLGQVQPGRSSVTALTSNPRYEHIRASLATGRVPWPGTCERCAFFRPHQQPRDELAHRRIRKVQVEASLACNLRCPGCSNGQQIRTRPKPFVLPEQTLAALVQALRAERYQVDEVEYCGQGEPLLHPRFGELVDLVRSSLPETRQRVITNGNVDYSAATGRRPLDEIFVSSDGVRQLSYEKYRVRGDVEMALRFMADVPPVLDGVPQTLVWKYILFEFNDSDAEIAEAQRRAQDLGVDQLLFVFTHSAFRSTRWTVANAAEFPMLYSNITTSATPVHDQRRREGRPGLPWGELRRRGRLVACAVVDEAAARGADLLVRGWAWLPRDVAELEVCVDGVPVGTARVGLPRPDVARVHPAFGGRTGFACSATVEPDFAGAHEVALRLQDRRGKEIVLRRPYLF